MLDGLYDTNEKKEHYTEDVLMMEASPQLHCALQTVVLALQHGSLRTDVRDLLIVRSINAGRLVGGGRLPSGLSLVLVVVVGGEAEGERCVMIQGRF